MKTPLLFLLVFGFTQTSFAFLENATHGYSNCLTCHYSPAGGDMLNDYGRSLSSELMSTWSAPGAERVFGGAVKETKWAKFGGDFRSVQRYLDTPNLEDRSFFIMQNNVEIGLKYKKIMLIGTLGTSEGPSSSPVKSDFISERHYVLAELSPTSRLRAGKFRVNYGLNDPNHNRLIKRSLGFGSYSEAYNLEYSKFYDNWDFFVNYSLGRVDRSRRSNDERSVSMKASHYLGGKSKIGLSYLYGETPSLKRFLIGTFGITPITEKSYVVYELDYEDKSPVGLSGLSGSQKVIAHVRAGYEVMKGFKAYGIYDIEHNVNDSNARITAPGLGMQWLPFPHFELQLEYQNMDFAFNQGANHFGFVMAHVYY